MDPARTLRRAQRRHLARRASSSDAEAHWYLFLTRRPWPAQPRLTTTDQPAAEADRTRTLVGISVRPARGPTAEPSTWGASCSVGHDRGNRPRMRFLRPDAAPPTLSCGYTKNPSKSAILKPAEMRAFSHVKWRIRKPFDSRIKIC